MTKFEADGITVLRFSPHPDRSGEIFPPECEAIFDTSIPVTFEDETVGKVRLRREGNELLGDFKLKSSWDSQDALNAISELIPCVYGRIAATHGMKVMKLEIISVSLSFGNADKKIKPLGSRVSVAKGKGLH